MSDEQRGRGSSLNTPNRFVKLLYSPEDCDPIWREEWESSVVKTQFYKDDTKTIVSQNESPDVGFRYSINPYRGCEHGCAYCYARPGHEYLGLQLMPAPHVQCIFWFDSLYLCQKFFRSGWKNIFPIGNKKFWHYFRK